MKNKIIAGVIATLFLPAIFAIRWSVEQFLLAKIVFGFILIVLIIVLMYKFSKLLLDEWSEKCKKNHEKN